MKRLLTVFAMLSPDSIYSRSITLYLILLERWKKHFPEVSRIWEENLYALIEEDGELSFSVLSRTVLADSSKSSFHTLNKAYVGQSMYRQAMAELDTDLQTFSREASLHVVLSVNSKEVDCLSKFLELHLRTVHRGSLKIYPRLGKGASFYDAPNVETSKSYVLTLDCAYLRSTPSARLSVPAFEPPSIFLCMDELLNSVANKLLENNNCGTEIKHLLYPQELEPMTDESSEFEDLPS